MENKSAGVWVKASERLPQFEKEIHFRIDNKRRCVGMVKKLKNVWFDDWVRNEIFYQDEFDFSRIEWLDEGQQFQSQQQSNIAMQGGFSKDEVYPLPPLQQEGPGLKKFEQQEDKSSDEDLEKLGAKYALNEYGYVGQEMHKRDFIKGFKFKACLQKGSESVIIEGLKNRITELLAKTSTKKGYSEDKSSAEEIEAMAEKQYPTPNAPFDKNNFKERIGFIKGLKYNGSEDKIGKAISWCEERENFFNQEIIKNQSRDRFTNGTTFFLNGSIEAFKEMKQFLQSLASK